MNFPHSFFITGTDTGVGKTLTAAMLMLGLDASYWKPIQSGTTYDTDTEWIIKTTDLPNSKFLPETYRLSQPLSPHLSAALDGIQIDLSNIKLPTPHPPRLLVEGAGGLMVPLNENVFMIDLIEQMAIPVLVVARSSLGTINHTVLTVQELQRRNVDVFGIVMNGEPNEDNRQAIEHFTKVPVLAQIPTLSAVNRNSLFDCFRKHFRSVAQTAKS